MKLFKKDITDNYKEIRQVWDTGNIRYKVVFVTKYVIHGLFGDSESETREESNVLFYCTADAERYAKLFVKPEQNVENPTYNYHFQVFPAGYETLKSYGVFLADKTLRNITFATYNKDYPSVSFTTDDSYYDSRNCMLKVDYIKVIIDRLRLNNENEVISIVKVIQLLMQAHMMICFMQVKNSKNLKNAYQNIEK